MTSDDNKPGFDEQPDNEMESIEIETIEADELGGDVGEALDDLERELSHDDEIDMNAEEDFSFDIDEEQTPKRGGGGIMKVAAPALVLLLAAGAGGYIVMNPDVIGKLMGNGGTTPPAMQQTAQTAPSAFGALEEDTGSAVETDMAELPQPAGVVNEMPRGPEAGLMGGGMDSAPVVAESEELAAPDNFVTAVPESMPLVDEPEVPAIPADSEPEAEELAAAEFTDTLVTEETAVETVTATDESTVDEPAVATAVQEDFVESGDDMPEQGSADDAGPVVEASAEEAVAPPMPEEIPAQPVAPARESAPQTTAQAAPQAAPQATPATNPQNNISTARPPRAAGRDEPTTYYESGVNLPSGPMADQNIRRVDPEIEPAQKYIIATQDADKSSQEAVLQSARRALDLQRYDAALELYEQLYAKNRRDERILMGLAIAQQHTGRNESAIQTYEALLDLYPNNANAMVNMLGLLRNTYPEVALRRLLDLQDKFPNNAGIAAQIGVTQADLGHFDDAIRYLQIAASLEPQNAQHLFNIAVIADRKGATADAIRYYEEALETDAVYQGGRSLPRETIYDRLAKLRRHN